MKKSRLHIENLSAGYCGTWLLHNISLSLNEGEALTIIGQNGTGKSTLLKTIARIIRDNEGTLYFDGMDLQQQHAWDLKGIGISFFVQGGLIFPSMSVSQHFALALGNKSRMQAEILRNKCFSYFPELKTLYPTLGGNLSGGQRQMLAFAMLFMQETRCWLLDEPTAGLAPAAVKQAVSFLKLMKQEYNVSMLLIEHNYEVAFELADKVSILKEDGRLYGSFGPGEFQKDNFLSVHLYN